MKKFMHWCKKKSTGLLILRIVLGLVFIMHGLQKMTNNFGSWYDMTGVIQFFDQIHLGTFWAYVDVFVEIIAGLMVLLGVFTRYAAVLLAIVMVVAIKVKMDLIGVQLAQTGQSFPWYLMYFQIEPELTLLLANVALFFTGGGKYSLMSLCKCHKNAGSCKVCEIGGCDVCECGEGHSHE